MEKERISLEKLYKLLEFPAEVVERLGRVQLDKDEETMRDIHLLADREKWEDEDSGVHDAGDAGFVCIIYRRKNSGEDFCGYDEVLHTVSEGACGEFWALWV